MPQFSLGDATVELPDEATPEQIRAAITAFRSTPAFDALVDKRRGAPAEVRTVVGGAPIADRLANLQRYYPDAVPYGNDNFVFTDPETSRPTLYNPTGFDTGDVFSIGREVSQAVGGTLGAVAGSVYPGVGTVIGAGAGTAAGGELFDIAAQVGMGQRRTEGMGGALLDIALDFGAGAVGQRGGELLGQGVKRALGGGTEAARRLVDGFRSLRIDPPAAAVSSSRTVATMQHTLENASFSGDVLQKQAEAVIAQTKAAADRIVASVGQAQTTQGAGEVIRRAAVGAAERFGFRQEELYTDAFNLVGADTPVPMTAVTDLLNTMAVELSRAPRALASSLRPGIEMLKSIQQDAAATGGIPFQALRQIRTDIGRDIAQPLLSGSSGARNEVLKRIYGALTADMSDAAKAAGPDAAQKLAVADRYTRQWMNTAAKTMEKINRFEADERAFNFAWQSARDGGTALARLRRNFLPEEWDTVAASVLGRLGRATPHAQDATGEAFSVSTFLTNWSRLAPEAKQALFGGKRYVDLRQQLDTLVDVVGSLKGVERLTNTSNTARNMIAWSTMHTLAGALGGLTVGGTPESAIAGALGVVVAPRVAAKLLTHPRFVEWLVTPVTESNAISAHIGRLAAIGIAAPEIKDELDKYFQALRGAQGESGSKAEDDLSGSSIGDELAGEETPAAVAGRLLARDPQKVYGDLLPLARDKDSGDLSFAVPEILREGLLGVADLLTGTRTGEITDRAALSVPALQSAAARAFPIALRGSKVLGAGFIHDIEIPAWNTRGGLDVMQVYQRPSKADVAKLLKKHGSLRALKDHRSGDVYVFDAEAGLHEDAIRHLGGDMIDNAGTIHSTDDFLRLTGNPRPEGKGVPIR